MTYEKHIETLERKRRRAHPCDVQAFDAAIELMRAAELKDEAAEREHTIAALERIFARDGCFSADWPDVCELVAGERAAARAEVEAKYAPFIDRMRECYGDLPRSLQKLLKKLLTAME